MKKYKWLMPLITIFFAYSGNSFGSEPPVLGGAIIYHMHTSVGTALNACNNERDQIAYSNPNSNPSCELSVFSGGRRQYYVKYTYHQVAAPSVIVSTRNRYVYATGVNGEFDTREDAIEACHDFWRGAESAPDYDCVDQEDSTSKFIEHDYDGSGGGDGKDEGCGHYYRYDSNKPPTVSITAPASGATFYNNTSVTFSGTASDPNQGNLSSSIKWAITGGITRTGSSFSLYFDTLGTKTIAAKVTDNKGEIDEATRSITIIAHSIVISTPIAVVDNPHEANKPVNLSVSTATIDGNDARGSVQWSSNINGNLGSGGSILPILSPGVHTITASLSKDGNSKSTQTTVTIVPHVVIGTPVAITDDPHESYKPVNLSVNTATIGGNDARGSVQWSSNIDGDLGTGGSISPTLSPGVHTITASLTAEGNSKSAQTVVTIINDRPHLTVDLPLSGRIFDIKEDIDFQAGVMFRGQPSLAAAITWTSSLDGSLGSGDSFNLSGLSEGKHEIAVTASLNGETDQKTVFLTIYDKEKNLGDENDGQCFGGNPINLLTGNKYHEEIDFSTATELPLYLKRSYNSSSDEIGLFGHGWSSNIEERVVHDAVAQQAEVVNDTGAVQRFDYVNGVWVDESSDEGQLEQLPDGSWRYTIYDQTVKTYNSQGQILSIEKLNGLSLTFNYIAGKLDLITGDYGYTLSFGYDADGFINRVTDPDSHVYRYQYNDENLVYAIYPDDTAADPNDNPRKQYHYENALFPHALTGLTDEEGIRFATWSYDVYGRANYSKHAADKEEFRLFFNADGTVTTENDAGKLTTYHYESVKGLLKITAVEGHQSANCAAGFQHTTYDPETGFADSKIDWRGIETKLTHNEFGQLETMEVIDTGTGWSTEPVDERTKVVTQYNSLRLPWMIDKAGLHIEKTYTAHGRIDLVTATDTTTHTIPYPTADETRLTDYTYTLYDGSDVVHVVEIDGPRTDVDDTVSYEYDTKGNLIKVTNALDHMVEFQGHNARGLPARKIDANGLVTDYEYSARGWLLKATLRSTKGDAVTGYAYYDNGMLKQVTEPNDSSLIYHYNDARQLDYVENNLGERQDYDPHGLHGDWTQVAYKATDGSIRFQQSRTFDELGKPFKWFSPEGRDIVAELDLNGNATRTTIQIEFGGVTESRVENADYDALNRQRRYGADDEATVEYKYDPAGNLEEVKVIGDSNQITRYVYNGFGEVIQEDSPATGATVFYRDEAGNIVRELNSESQETIKTYDALDRLKTVSHTGAAAENIAYDYDQGDHALGRLSGITDQSGSQTLHYDVQGYVDSIDYVIESAGYNIDYDFDKNGQLEWLTYPTGRQIEYLYDALGRIEQVNAHGGAQGTVTLVDDVSYEPFGPMKSLLFGNGLTRQVDYDHAYRPDAIHHGWLTYVETVDYGFDTADRIRSQQRTLQFPQIDVAMDSKAFAYDRAHRLTEVNWSRSGGKRISANNEFIEYDYDTVGNRTDRRRNSQNSGSGTVSEAWRYTVDAGNNQLDGITHATDGVNYQNTHSYAYDDTGNTETDDEYVYVHNRRQRLASVSEDGQVIGSYLYNAHGQRVRKQAGSETVHFHYDLNGRLIAETDASGALIREYAWLGNMPVAMMAGDKLYDGVDSSSQLLDGDGRFDLDAPKNAESTSLMTITGDSHISGYLSDSSNKTGKESVGFTVREQQDGLTGAKVDVYFSAVNSSDMSMTVVKTPDNKTVPIITWSDSTSDEALEIDVVQADGSIHHETLVSDDRWLKLERDGQFIRIDVSTDGQTWTQLREFDVPMLDNAYMGAIASNATANIAAGYTTANDNLFYLHTDHLNAVYAVSSNSSKHIVWQRNDFAGGASPFGWNDLPGGNALHSGLFEMPLRFPGQYFDAETGKHYNYFRDYDPEIGRYLQSDPIGLVGGINTYSNVLNNPLMFADPLGLDVITMGGSLKVPGWLIRLFAPDFLGEGASCGIALSGPDKWGNGKFDLGFYLSLDFKGTEDNLPNVNLGGRLTFDMGMYEGSVKDLAGVDAEIGAHTPYGVGVTVVLDENGVTGGEINLGPGINAGGNASMTATLSIREGLISFP